MNQLLQKTGRAEARPSGGSRSRGTRLHALLLLSLAVCLAVPAAANELPVIVLVRHAERAATSGRVPSDTGLSAEGKARAQSLARALRDANITAIYTSEYKRTKDTAVPLADSSGVRPEVIPADDLRSLLAKLKASRGNALVIGHSNTLPQIINALGVKSRVTVAETDYDDLFLVVLEQPPRLVHLHYR